MKNLEALQIYRDGDAHVVEHHHAEGPPETHRFKSRNQAAAHILSNLERLGPPQSEGIEEQEDGGRPASFDCGSTQVGEIQGRRK